MRVVVQKVTSANVKVSDRVVGLIDRGLVLLVGFTSGDNSDTIDYMINKIIKLRIFEDDRGIMNLSIKDVGGSILSISQFTLYGDASKGNRPSYQKALNGESAVKLYDEFNSKLEKEIPVAKGVFGASMQVSLINDGPTTIILER